MKQLFLLTIILQFYCLSFASDLPKKDPKTPTCREKIIQAAYASGKCVRASASIFGKAIKEWQKQMFPDPSDSNSDSESD